MSSIPYGRQDISQGDIDAVVDVLQSDFLTQGPAVENFERALANYCGVRHVTAVNSATSALQRIQAIVPEQLKSTFDTTNLMVPDLRSVPDAATRLPEIRGAIKSKTKIFIEYKREDKTPSKRTLWPLGLFFWGQVWTLVAWCELRGGHRQFRIDRIESIDKLGQVFSETPEQLLEAYLLSVVCEGGPVLK